MRLPSYSVWIQAEPCALGYADAHLWLDYRTQTVPCQSNRHTC